MSDTDGIENQDYLQEFAEPTRWVVEPNAHKSRTGKVRRLGPDEVPPGMIRRPQSTQPAKSPIAPKLYGDRPFIGIDGEWVNIDRNRNRVLCFQYSGHFNGHIWTGILYLQDGTHDWGRPSIGDLVGCALKDAIERRIMTRYPEATPPKGQEHLNHNTHVNVVAHMSLAEMSHLGDFSRIKQNVVQTESKCLVTINYPLYAETASATKLRYYNRREKREYTSKVRKLAIHLYDTKFSAPTSAGQGLKDVGAVIGLGEGRMPKVEDENGDRGPAIKRMDLCMAQHPDEFERYSARDPMICSEVAARLSQFFSWFLTAGVGEDVARSAVPLPISLNNAAVQYVQNLLTEDKDDSEFMQMFGLERRGDVPAPKFGSEARALGKKAIAVKASKYENAPGRSRVEAIATKAVKGGRNELYRYGPQPSMYPDTYKELDLPSAYANIIGMLQKPDWANAHELENIDHWTYETLGVAPVDFEFPADTQYPCIAVTDDQTNHGLIFPLSGRRVYSTAPEIWLARQMGADVRVHTASGTKAVEVPWMNDGEHPLRDYVNVTMSMKKQFGDKAKHRARQKALDEGETKDKDFDYNTSKQLANGLYGKTIQGATEKSNFDARTGKSGQVPTNKITCPMVGAYITGMVRALLSEIIWTVPQDHKLVYATTDSIMTTATKDEVRANALPGGLIERFERLLEENGVAKLGDSEVLEQKLGEWKVFGLRTRNYIGLDIGVERKDTPKKLYKCQVPAGRLGANGWMAKHEDAADGILNFLKARTPKTKLWDDGMLVTFRQLWYTEGDLTMDEPEESKPPLDFDFKRKALDRWEDDGFVGFTTAPWASVEEFRAARSGFDDLCKRGDGFVMRSEADLEKAEEVMKLRVMKRRTQALGGDAVAARSSADTARVLIGRAYYNQTHGFDGKYRLCEALGVSEGRLAKQKRSAPPQDAVVPLDAETKAVVDRVLRLEPKFQWWRLISDEVYGASATRSDLMQKAFDENEWHVERIQDNARRFREVTPSG